MFTHSFRRSFAKMVPILSLAVFASLVLLTVPPALAQAPDIHDPASITSWIKLNALIAGLVLTVVWKYVPGLKDLSNRVFLPWLQLLVSVAAIFGGHDIATAAVNPAAAAASISFWAKFAAVILNFTASKNLWDGLFKPTLGTALDAITGRTPQTP